MKYFVEIGNSNLETKEPKGEIREIYEMCHMNTFGHWIAMNEINFILLSTLPPEDRDLYCVKLIEPVQYGISKPFHDLKFNWTRRIWCEE